MCHSQYLHHRLGSIHRRRRTSRIYLLWKRPIVRRVYLKTDVLRPIALTILKSISKYITNLENVGAIVNVYESGHQNLRVTDFVRSLNYFTSNSFDRPTDICGVAIIVNVQTNKASTSDPVSAGNGRDLRKLTYLVLDPILNSAYSCIYSWNARPGTSHSLKRNHG